MMNWLVWNIRGIGGKKSQQQMWYMCRNLKLNLFVILEPMVQLDVFKYSRMFGMEKVIANCSNKIWIFSDANYEVEVLEDQLQLLHCRISSSQLSCPLLMTFVYAKCTRSEREDL